MPEVLVKQKAPVLSDEQIDKMLLEQIADGFAK